MKVEIMKTKQDYLNLLEETVNHYTIEKNQRARSGHGCYYYYVNGNMCAVGRCLIKPQNKDNAIQDENNTGVRILLKKFTNKIFKPEYRGYKTEFWELLQDLHDTEHNFADFDLTSNGKNRVEKIKKWIEKEL